MHFSLYKTLTRRDLLRFGLIGTAVICALFVGGTLLHRQTVPTAAGGDFDRTVYLTFDDGPSPVTLQILDTLSQKGVTATFFVVGENAEKHPDILRRIVSEGHSVGIHSYTHDYAAIYKNKTAFFADFDRLAELIDTLAGVKSRLYRFPGGSSNTLFSRYSQSSSLMSDIQAELLARGVTYVDWNVSAEDAVGYKKSADSIVSSVVRQVQRQYPAVVLMHDTTAQQTTADALSEIIDRLKELGFTFSPLSENVSCRHGIDAYR